MKVETEQLPGTILYGIWDDARKQWVPSMSQPEIYLHKMWAMARVKKKSTGGAHEVVRVFGKYEPGEVFR